MAYDGLYSYFLPLPLVFRFGFFPPGCRLARGGQPLGRLGSRHVRGGAAFFGFPVRAGAGESVGPACGGCRLEDAPGEAQGGAAGARGASRERAAEAWLIGVVCLDLEGGGFDG